MTAETQTPMILSGPVLAPADRSSPQPGIDAAAYVLKGRYFSPEQEQQAGIEWCPPEDGSDTGYYRPAERVAPMTGFVFHRPAAPAFQAEDERKAAEVQERVEGRKAGKVYPGDEVAA